MLLNPNRPNQEHLKLKHKGVQKPQGNKVRHKVKLGLSRLLIFQLLKTVKSLRMFVKLESEMKQSETLNRLDQQVLLKMRTLQKGKLSQLMKRGIKMSSQS